MAARKKLSKLSEIEHNMNAAAAARRDDRTIVGGPPQTPSHTLNAAAGLLQNYVSNLPTLPEKTSKQRSRHNDIENENEYNELGNEVVDYDPKISLTPGGDGLDSYRQIISNAREKLRKNGQLVLEIGYSQAEPVKKLLDGAGFSKIRVHKDLGSRDRVLSAQVASGSPIT